MQFTFFTDGVALSHPVFVLKTLRNFAALSLFNKNDSIFPIYNFKKATNNSENQQFGSFTYSIFVYY